MRACVSTNIANTRQNVSHNIKGIKSPALIHYASVNSLDGLTPIPGFVVYEKMRAKIIANNEELAEQVFVATTDCLYMLTQQPAYRRMGNDGRWRSHRARKDDRGIIWDMLGYWDRRNTEILL